MSSTLLFLDQFNAPSTEGGKRTSIYTPKHTHVSDSTLLTLLLSNPTDVFNKLKTHHPEATNATDCAALEVYLSACHEYDEAVKAADEAIDHHKRLLRQQDDHLPIAFNHSYHAASGRDTTNSSRAPSPTRTYPYLHPYRRLPSGIPRSHPLFSKQHRRALSSRLTGNPTLVGPQREAVGDVDRLDTGYGTVRTYNAQDAEKKPLDTWSERIINEAKERKERERQTKAVPIPPPRSANPKPQASPITGSSRPRPDTPIVFHKVDPDWTPDTTQWTWDSSWPCQEHLSGEEWKNVGRNARNEWFDEEEDNSVDWELYGDGEHLHNGVRAHFVPGIVPLRFFLY
ncbi:predicted protein [Postia placenta Mad-698-R]|uniref:Uncharacterized protein n=1 Tax=Postia placenta MAD-698-R-SB12 TaxID=670580 RepID=A0A1X6MS81_9APHY|nr:hypothetical protein POSPLADRAFT_1151575 [Postia placenta MAD-698-R-SB12]EED81614.1 predicted protein [Postia placenta Mad-698-R]OSX59043.1 hypothetical protein POSPLADRAFT_1151575 [Postia placenta MAD-698-R-SB12]